MKKFIVGVFLLSLLALPAFAASPEFAWSPNVEPDMKNYNVYICKVKGCVASDLGSLWVGSVPHVFVNPPAQYTFPVPLDIEGAAVITAEDKSGNKSGPSNMVSFSTVPNLPPAAPTTLQVR